jgi:hypothetical protein
MLGLWEGRMKGKNEYRFSVTCLLGGTTPGHAFSSSHSTYSVPSRYLLHIFGILLGFLGQ